MGKVADFDGSSRVKYAIIPNQVQRSVVAWYRKGDRQHSYAACASRFRITRATAQAIIRRAKSHKGDPCQPRGHRPRLLTAREEKKLAARVDANGSLTNRMLSIACGSKLAPRTVSDVLRRAEPTFTKKRFIDQEPEQLSDDWKSQMMTFITSTLRRLPWAKRIYGDESFFYANEAPTYGRGRRGSPLLRTRSYYARKYTFHAYVSLSGPIYWELAKVNANDSEIQRVCRRVTSRVKKCKYLLWDRLGRSGRALHPVKQHWNPDVIQRFADAGVRCILLPPKGKYLNPIELLFNDLKRYVRSHYTCTRPFMTLARLRTLINRYMRGVTAKKMKGFFEKRANGRELFDLNLLSR